MSYDPSEFPCVDELDCEYAEYLNEIDQLEGIDLIEFDEDFQSQTLMDLDDIPY